jgi:hypothetical protein
MVTQEMHPKVNLFALKFTVAWSPVQGLSHLNRAGAGGAQQFRGGPHQQPSAFFKPHCVATETCNNISVDV